jgi:hypothetical protein
MKEIMNQMEKEKRTFERKRRSGEVRREGKQ